MKTLTLALLGMAIMSTSWSPWKIAITSKDEPGEPMVVTGQVFAPDGITPLSGMRVYVYHTDARGLYNERNSGTRVPRLKGTMVTNDEGWYEYSTIRPAPYPGGGVAAHVHYNVSGGGYQEFHDALEFEGDQYLTDKEISESRSRGRFGSIQVLTKDKGGVWRCTKDIRMEKK
ncbi:MAG: hypothetical protein WBD36_12370 [Bacteroidota bacterium]